jgi:hypothetical protein
MHEEVRYELVVSDKMEEELGYEFEIFDDVYFTMTGDPDASYRCYHPHNLYGHDQFFKRLSEKYPEEVIALKGDGQDRKDFWIKYYRNGRVQEEQGEIVYPEFDGAKLKPID